MTFPRQGPNPLDARAGLRRWFSALGVSLGTAILVVTPFFWRGNASGHDIAFHASSWLDVAEQWKEGIVYPRWCQWANNGFGEPRFIFYPPLSWMLGAALGFVAPWSAVPGLLIVLAATLGGVSIFGLAGFYLVPALYEQRWVNIRQALSPGLEPAQNFLYTTLGDPEHNAFNWVASSVAMLLMALTTIAALLGRSASENRDNGTAAGKLWRVMAVLGVAAAVLMIPPSSLLWELLPELRFIQFPWRWTGIVAVPYAFFGAGAIGRATMRWIWASVVILAVAGTATFLVRKAWWDSDDIPVLEDAIASGQGFDGTDEYDPISDDHTDLPAKAPQVQILPAKDAQSSAPKAEIRIVRWTAEEKELSVTSPRPLRLAIRLLDYPAWRVEVNGQSVTPQSRNGTAQMILPLPAGRARIRLSFKRTLDRDLGNVLSGVSAFALLAALWGVAGRRSRPRLEDSRDQSS